MDDDAGALPPKQDFSGWYNDLLWRAEIMDVRYPVKGLYVGTRTGLRSVSSCTTGSAISSTATTRRHSSRS